MIKINLTLQQRDKIEELVWSDANNAPTGIIKELNNYREDIKKDYPLLYDYFFLNDELVVENVKKLLLASKYDLKKYIKKFKKIEIKSKNDILKKVFNYDNFSNRKVVIKILRIMEIDVCPYCNRQYILTTRSGHVRAQLDHYYPKDIYPYLALSIYNLIPCCSNCNIAKSDLDTNETPILYPYEEEFQDNMTFNIKINDKNNYVKVIQGVSDDFQVIIENVENNKLKVAGKVKNQIERLHIDELYNEHKSYIQYLMKSKYINSSTRIHALMKQFPNLFKSENDVKSMIYTKNIEKKEWNKSSLAKLTHDIDQCVPR